MSIVFSSSRQQSKRIPKLYTYGFKKTSVHTLEELAACANKGSISGPRYKNNHRKGESIAAGSNIILIDCDEPGQAETVERKIQHYDYVKVPSASNLEKPYKWHFFVPTQEPMSVFPAAFRWQIEQFFRQVGIDDDMIDTTASYDAVRQFAPASISMELEEADELIEVNNADLRVPILSEVPIELCSAAAKSKSVKIKGITTEALPAEHLWYQGKAITYIAAIKAVRQAEQAKKQPDDRVVISSFGCPHDNHEHSGDITSGYAFAFIGRDGDIIVKCTGNACKDHPYFVIPEKLMGTEVEIVDIESKINPIHPSDFVQLMRARMLELNPDHHFAKKSDDAYFNFGAIYNEVANRNRDELPPKRIVVPLSTGSGKTVSAKLYMAELAKKGISGLLVVKEIDTAIEAAKEINTMAETDVVKVYYKISQDNPDSELRCDITDPPLILIISHSLFINRSYTGMNINLLKNYNGKSRRAIIIDESINLVRSVSFGSEEIRDLVNILERDSRLKEYITGLEIAMKTTEGKVNVSTKDNDVMEEFFTTTSNSTNAVIASIKDGNVNINPRMRKKRDARETEISNTLSLLERISFVFSGHFTITSEGRNRVFHRDIDLSGAFGSVVVLDATSTINPLYTFHQVNSDNIQFMSRIDLRNYLNVTANICQNKNLPQSISALYTTPLKAKMLDEVIDQYLTIIENIIEPQDRLLVVTFKKLVPKFKQKCPFKNVEFIHYGSTAARGSNKFKDFNKAMAIGLFRRPRHTYNGTVMSIASINSYISSNGSITRDATQLKNHLIVDDLVQFFNRVRCRISIDNEGNCQPVQLYLFTEGKDSMKQLFEDLISEEMPNINFSDWKVDANAKLVKARKKNKLYELAERVIEWMLAISHEYDIVSQKEVIDYFGFTKAKMTRLKKEPHFQHRCKEEDIVEFKEGRSYMFHLPANR